MDANDFIGAGDSPDGQRLFIELAKPRPGGTLLSRVTVHRFMCKRGCQLGIVYEIGGTVWCWTAAYRQSPGLNDQVSVERARRNRTLDGERHWPAHVHDIDRLGRFDDGAGILLACRHVRRAFTGRAVLDLVGGVTPGKPGGPTIL